MTHQSDHHKKIHNYFFSSSKENNEDSSLNMESSPLLNIVMIILTLNTGWMILRHKYHIGWLPVNFVNVVLAAVVSCVFYYTGHTTASETTEGLDGILNPSQIYIYALPFIVMGEGFAQGNLACMMDVKTLISVATPSIIKIFSTSLLIFYSCNAYFEAIGVTGGHNMFHHYPEAL